MKTKTTRKTNLKEGKQETSRLGISEKFRVILQKRKVFMNEKKGKEDYKVVVYRNREGIVKGRL